MGKHAPEVPQDVAELNEAAGYFFRALYLAYSKNCPEQAVSRAQKIVRAWKMLNDAIAKMES